MKSILTIVILLLSLPSFSQDSTFRCIGGRVEVKRVGIGKMHTVEGKQRDQTWISGKVKRVNYEYMYTRTYHGSTQPANPTEFYKPIKKKSFYFVPVEDIVIKYKPNGQVFQRLSMDSLVLRSYLENGTPRNVYYLNTALQVDSMCSFYENSKLHTKVIGGSDQPIDNLVLSFSRGRRPEMGLRNPPREWIPDYQYRSAAYASDFLGFGSEYRGSKTPSYPKRQYHCHGNGKPHLVISWLPDSTSAHAYRAEYKFFDPQGNSLDSNRISNEGTWTGIRYRYYKNGMLQSVGGSRYNVFCGKNEYWNPDGTRKYIEYLSKTGRDSIVYFKQLKDTLLTWRPPMHFVWNQNDMITEVNHRHLKVQFKHDGGLHSFGGIGGYTDRLPKDERMRLEHFGTKDELGFPHGKWYGVNAFNDTIYEVNFHHGWLHGLYRVNGTSWPNNWIRNYDMGLEVDSSVRMYKGNVHDIHYFSEPGKLVKKAVFNGDGRLSGIDTTLNGKTFIPLRRVHFEGWDMELSIVDSSNKTIYTKQFFSKDSLALERWTNYSGKPLERKSYHRETGALEIHWKSLGFKKNSDGANQQPLVKLATRWTYDLSGTLIKKENLENGTVVDE